MTKTQKHAKLVSYIELRQAIADLIQPVMPWPFSDVGRDSAEGRESAEAIAAACLPTIVREFNDLRAAGRRRTR